jgi:CheY-like chemotaxis protein
VQAADSATTAVPVPAAQAAAATPRRTQAADQGLPLVADLLLVDDSAVVRAKLRRLFEPAGFRIALARDGAEALALLGAGRYALMLTDLEMPKLDGVGLIRATLALPACASMPILAITGHDDLQSQLNQLNAVAGIYRKPWVDDDLLGHVQALVQPAALRELATAEA